MRPVKGMLKLVHIRLAPPSFPVASLFPTRPDKGANEQGRRFMARNNVVEAGQPGLAQDGLPSPIDMVHLEQQSLGDPGLQEEVLRLYSQMSGVYLARIEDSVTTEDLVRNLHTLKSAAAGIGAWQVRDLAKHAEDALREGQMVKPEHIAAIASAVDDCRHYIAGLVGSDE